MPQIWYLFGGSANLKAAFIILKVERDKHLSVNNDYIRITALFKGGAFDLFWSQMACLFE